MVYGEGRILFQSVIRIKVLSYVTQCVFLESLTVKSHKFLRPNNHVYEIIICLCRFRKNDNKLIFIIVSTIGQSFSSNDNF